jgi:hypothetical protein
MTSPSPMMLYSGHVAIGEIRDGGPGSVSAIYITATGRRLPLGFHKDRWSAREAIEARHAGGPEPPPREGLLPIITVPGSENQGGGVMTDKPESKPAPELLTPSELASLRQDAKEASDYAR